MKLTQLTKWDNLFWSQPTTSNNDSISSIENNMTKNLLYILTNKHCKKIKKNFLKKLDLKESKVIDKQCQISTSAMNSYEDKPTYFIYLNKKKSDEKAERSLDTSNLYDGYIEFEDYNLIFEVKVNSPTDKNQIEKYKKDFKKVFGGNYKEIQKITWDDIHDILMKSVNSKGIEKIFAEEYVNLMEVSGMVNKFYGFKGSTIAEHNHELRWLLSEFFDKTNRSNYEFNDNNRKSEAWISIYKKNKKDKIHLTIFRNPYELEFYLTIHDWSLSKKFVNSIIMGNYDKKIKEIIQKQKKGEGKQKDIGRTFNLVLSNYNVLNPETRVGGSYSDLRVLYRIDDKLTKSKKEKFKNKDYVEDLKKIQDLYGSGIKQVQLGYNWSLNYSKTRKKWENPDFALSELKDVFEDIEFFYDELLKK